MIPLLKKIYKREINIVTDYLINNQNILISSSDEYITNIVISSIKLYFSKLKWDIRYVNSKQDIEEKSLIIINAEGNKSMSTTAFLYYYLEICEKKACKLILYSKSCLVIDNMEKRVRSRFSNEVCILNSLTRQYYIDLYLQILKKNNKKIKHISQINLEELEFQYEINNSIDSLLKFYKKSSYNIKEYTIYTTFSMLNNIHIILLILSSHKLLQCNTVLTEFKKFTLKCKELKKTTSDDILSCYADLLDFSLINEKGNLLFDTNDLKIFISKESPRYLKSLKNYIGK